MKSSCDMVCFALFLGEVLHKAYFASKTCNHYLVPMCPVTNCLSLPDALRKQAMTTTEKRGAISFASIRDVVGYHASKRVATIPTLADVLRKICPIFGGQFVSA